MNTSYVGATTEVVRRPRGRPPGAKNRQKTRVVMPRQPEPFMSPYVLEIPAGRDIVDSLYRFCICNNTGIVVLNGTGSVSNVALRDPASTCTFTCFGTNEIVLLSATITPPNTTSNVNNYTFTITVSALDGRVIGGILAGPLRAANDVRVSAVSFKNPTFVRLSFDDYEERSSPSSGFGFGDGGMVDFGQDLQRALSAARMSSDGQLPPY